MPHIPPSYPKKFENGINHPHLFLWDSWSYVEENVIHLYSLAISRLKADGTPLPSGERNSFPFHFRHFSSEDNGKSWKDEGCFLKKGEGTDRHDSRTVWSGSTEVLPDGRKLVAYTGLNVVDTEHLFLQNIALAISSDGYTIAHISDTAISSPKRDYDEITRLGYYLDTPDNLGSNEGEDEGPILAWRDPFIFIDTTGEINLFWAAKVGPLKNAIARAVLTPDGDLFKIAKLFPPVTLPDGHKFTQLELPKIVYDKEKSLYYLMISSCNRLYEGQADSEVDKGVRLYRANAIDGPWEPLGGKLLGEENLFGPTILKTDFKNDRLLCIAPYTEAAEESLRLTFAPVFYIYLDLPRLEFL